MEEMNHGYLEPESGQINRGRKAGNHIMNLPNIELSKLLVPTKFGAHFGVVKCPKRSGEAAPQARSHEFLRGAKKILYVMILLQGVSYPKDRGFFPTKLNIAVEDLEDPQALHGVKVRALKA